LQHEDFVWPIDTSFHERFIIDVEFLDLKIVTMNGGEACSIWPNEGAMQCQTTQGALKCLSRMVDDEYIIMGSTNINECSLESSRGTQIAMGSYQPLYTWASRRGHLHGQVYGYRMSL